MFLLMNAVENYLFWSVSLVTIFFFFKGRVYEDYSKVRDYLLADEKTRLHLVEIYLLEILMRAWVSVCVLLKTSFYI